jgi:hypothetical protein
MRIVGVFLTLAIGTLLASPAVADNGCDAPACCSHCGCMAACKPVTCQVVAGVVKEKKYCWCVKEEEFSPLMPGCLPSLHGAFGGLLGGLGCGLCKDCGDCGTCGPCCHGHEMVPPQCGQVRTKRILVKKEYEIEVPVYKTVIKDLCSDCGADPAVIGPKPASGPAPGPAPAPQAPGAPLPPPPAPMPGQQAYNVAPLPPTF